MLLSSSEKLKEGITRTLAERGTMTAGVLHERISGSFQECTLQAIYQELRNLQRTGVVLKHRDSYSLRLSWVLGMRQLVDVMYENALSSLSLEGLLHGAERRKQWRFHNLQSLVGFYTHLALVLLGTSEPTCYDYVPHVWYHLAHSQAESQFLEAVRQQGYRYFLIVAGETYLDTQYRRYVSQETTHISFGKHPFAKKLESSYFIVIGDYISVVRIGKSLEHKLDSLYARVTSAKSMEIGAIHDVFEARSAISLTLERNPKEAALLKRKFHQYFGVPMR